MVKANVEMLNFDTEVEAADYLENLDFEQSNDQPWDWHNKDGRWASLTFRDKASVQGGWVIKIRHPADAL